MLHLEAELAAEKHRPDDSNASPPAQAAGLGETQGSRAIDGGATELEAASIYIPLPEHPPSRAPVEQVDWAVGGSEAGDMREELGDIGAGAADANYYLDELVKAQTLVRELSAKLKIKAAARRSPSAIGNHFPVPDCRCAHRRALAESSCKRFMSAYFLEYRRYTKQNLRARSFQQVFVGRANRTALAAHLQHWVRCRTRTRRLRALLKKSEQGAVKGLYILWRLEAAVTRRAASCLQTYLRRLRCYILVCWGARAAVQAAATTQRQNRARHVLMVAVEGLRRQRRVADAIRKARKHTKIVYLRMWWATSQDGKSARRKCLSRWLSRLDGAVSAENRKATALRLDHLRAWLRRANMSRVSAQRAGRRWRATRRELVHSWRRHAAQAVRARLLSLAHHTELLSIFYANWWREILCVSLSKRSTRNTSAIHIFQWRYTTGCRRRAKLLLAASGRRASCLCIAGWRNHVLLQRAVDDLAAGILNVLRSRCLRLWSSYQR